MTEVSRLLARIEAGEPAAADELLPLVYDELRRLAAVRIAEESPGHSLSATALVHEAYLRLTGDQQFDGRGHFFAAAAEAMRRVLVDSARRRMANKRGGDRLRLSLDDEHAEERQDTDVLCVDEVVDQLADHDPRAAQIVKLHVFVGCSIEEAGESVGISARMAFRDWKYAKAWMFRRLQK